MAIFNSFLYVYQRVRWTPPAMAAWILQRKRGRGEPLTGAPWIFVGGANTYDSPYSKPNCSCLNPHVSWFRVLNPPTLHGQFPMLLRLGLSMFDD